VEYPHKKYLIYLLTKRMSSIEILEECIRLSLLAPNQDYLDKLTEEIGLFPRSWEQEYHRRNEYFGKWLRSQGVLSLWRSDPKILSAIRFMYRRAVRKDFETLSLSHTTLESVIDTLKLKYQEVLVPDLETLKIFCDWFWNLSLLDQSGLFEFLSKSQNQSANLAAVEGNTSLSYSIAGLPEIISPETFYDNIIALANQQVLNARRTTPGEILTGNCLMGIAALTRQAMEAISAKHDLDTSNRIEIFESIREQASAFKLRTVQVEDIPTIEQLTSEQEDDDVPALTIVTK
jgi:hypothetical protein